MFISREDETHEVMIGEAVVNLLFSRKDITITALLDELTAMGNGEEDDERVLAIWSARRWLITRRKSSYPATERQDWLASPGRVKDDNRPQHEQTIRLAQYEDEEQF